MAITKAMTEDSNKLAEKAAILWAAWNEASYNHFVKNLKDKGGYLVEKDNLMDKVRSGDTFMRKDGTVGYSWVSVPEQIEVFTAELGLNQPDAWTWAEIEIMAAKNIKALEEWREKNPQSGTFEERQNFQSDIDKLADERPGYANEDTFAAERKLQDIADADAARVRFIAQLQDLQNRSPQTATVKKNISICYKEIKRLEKEIADLEEDYKLFAGAAEPISKF